MNKFTVLLNLLETNQKFAPFYAKGMSNHASMALIALYKLGATVNDLEKFFTGYKRKLKKISGDCIAIDDSNWLSSIGQEKHYLSFHKFFSDKYQELGFIRILEIYLPELIGGVGAAAFHALIRLAYAVELYHSGNDGNLPDNKIQEVLREEVVISLAYFADSYLLLPNCNTEEQNISLALGNITRINEIASTNFQGRLIFQKMLAAANTDNYKALAKPITNVTEYLPLIADGIISLYRKYPDFTILHGITSFHAMRLVLPFISDKEQAINEYWKALIAALLSVDYQQESPTAAIEEENTRSWEEISQATFHNDNEHFIKLIFSLREEASFYKSLTYLLAANAEYQRAIKT